MRNSNIHRDSNCNCNGTATATTTSTAERAHSAAAYNGNGGCSGSIVPSPRITFLYSARETEM